MNLPQTLNDPNFQKFITPLIIGIFGILSSWLGNQLPALKNGSQLWLILKLAVQAVVFTNVFNSWGDAVKIFSDSDSKASVAGCVYFVVLFLLIISIIVDFYRLVNKQTPGEVQNPELTRQQNNRQALMDKVRIKWLEGVLHNSLYQKARLQLGLEECSETLGLEWENFGQRREVLPPGTKLFDKFSQLGEGGTLLVLGEPGAGKTTLLLELAEDLLNCTDGKNITQPVPVVLNLSSWGTKQYEVKSNNGKALSLKDWIVEELYQNYQLKREIGKNWLEAENLSLLLDGLDEVSQPLRKSCLEAINQFRQDYGLVEMVVCCRVGDFQALATELNFQAAVFIQPLTVTQVMDYLLSAGNDLENVRLAVQQDGELQNLASNPLFLWILSLAYKGKSLDELFQLTNAQQLELLFRRYVEQMFRQRQMEKAKRQQMINWLAIIAKQMGAEKEFLIERIQPRDWLLKRRQKWFYRLIRGLIVGLIFGLIVGLIYGLIVGLIVGLIFGLDNIESVEVIDLSRFSTAKWEILQSLIVGLIGGLILGLIVGLIEGLIGGLIEGLILGLIVGLVGLIVGLIVGLKSNIKTRTRPNQGIWNSLKNMIIISSISLIFTLFLYLSLSFVLPMFLKEREVGGIFAIIPIILMSILFGFMFGGGMACIQHFALRLVLFRARLIPWDFVKFFQEAENRLFIQRTGGSYIFIHRYLQEYFATLAPRN